jgi:FtsP/CotA-like multicopper oxidase with cupredoxin domain
MSFSAAPFQFSRNAIARRLWRLAVPLGLHLAVVLSLSPLSSAFASDSNAKLAAEACPRPAEGSTVQSPPELRSLNGVLEVTFHFKYQATFAGQGPPRYCYVTDAGFESPTLRLHPGDQLIIHFHNDVPDGARVPPPPAGRGNDAVAGNEDCEAMTMSASTTNLHFHGLTVPPTCHQDDVIRTAIPAGTNFDYRTTIPADEPPGLYWYHPHPHGFSERQVQGGASGALIVEGIERAVPDVARLPQRVMVLRDQSISDLRFRNDATPAWDISINYVPILYPAYRPAVISAKPSTQELWRVVNAGADTILNLQFLVKGAPQSLRVVAIDGVPLARDAARSQTVSNIELPPGARAEFVITTPVADQQAELVTTKWNTGTEGDSDPTRPIVNIVSRADANEPAAPTKEKLATWKPYAKRADRERRIERRLYFSQFSPNPAEGDTSVFYYVTVAGSRPEEYRMGQAPNIVVHQGDVEDWMVENRAQEDHVFHIHQLHFQVLDINGKPVKDRVSRDTFNLPHWDGAGPYPSVKLRMDFRDPSAVGTSLYHCHILKHEDMGMMGVIEVLPPGIPATIELSGPQSAMQVATEVTFTAVTRKHASSDVDPSGTMQFLVDGIPAGRPIPLVDGKAALSTSFSSGGLHQIIAAYLGDARYDESMSKPLKVKVAGP